MIEILMIEDDPEFSEFLGEFLQPYNISITNYEDPFMGLTADFKKYDILILDLSLPGMDGLDICKRISNQYDIPIIISSARSDITDKVLALQIGADYYLPKPYNPKEMYAVIKSILRRRSKTDQKPEDNSIFQYNIKASSIKFKDEILNLTQAEYEVMLALLRDKNAILSREQIVNQCDSLTDSYSKSLDVIIGRLRAKIEEDRKNPKYILSIRGLGYKIVQ
jgi:two-component system OmpR family response regulator